MHTSSTVPLLRQHLRRNLQRLLLQQPTLASRLRECGVTLSTLRVQHERPWRGQSTVSQLLLAAEGQGTLHTPQRQLLVRSGDAVLIAAHQPLLVSPPSQPHTAPLQAVLLSVDDSLLNPLELPRLIGANSDTPLPPEPTEPLASLPPDTYVLEALNHLLQGLSTAEPAKRPILAHRAQELVLALASCAQPHCVRLLLPRTPPKLVEAVRHHIRMQPDYDWTADKLAQALAMSESTLRRKLRQQRCNLRTLLQEERMRYAAALLKQSTTSITDIALACGYGSTSRFSERFRALFHCSPSAYRRNPPPNHEPPSACRP